MLTPNERASFRQILKTMLLKRADVASDLARDTQQELHRRSDRTLPDRPEHQADPRSDEMEQEIDLALLENAELTINEIEAALARLNTGTYGVCVTCGQDIAKERLKALPSTPYCIQCARNAQ